MHLVSYFHSGSTASTEFVTPDDLLPRNVCMQVTLSIKKVSYLLCTHCTVYIIV